MEKKIRQRLMLQQTCQEQMEFRAMKKQAEKEEDEAFSQMMMAKFAEDDRIEQMNAQKRRMKQLEHRRAVERLIEDRKRQREADMVPLVTNLSLNTTLSEIFYSTSAMRWCWWCFSVVKVE